MPPETTSSSQAVEKDPLTSLVHALAWTIERELTSGEVSELRRMRPDHPGCPAFWKLAALRLEPAGRLKTDRDESRWAALLAGMAAMAGANLLQPGRRLGTALAAAGVAEPRVLRLLRAQDDALLDAVRTVARQLNAAAAPVDWADFAHLVFSDGRRREGRIRLRIASDYYRQANASPERSTK